MSVSELGFEELGIFDLKDQEEGSITLTWLIQIDPVSFTLAPKLIWWLDRTQNIAGLLISIQLAQTTFGLVMYSSAGAVQDGFLHRENTAL